LATQRKVTVGGCHHVNEVDIREKLRKVGGKVLRRDLITL
jgi:hypothetical protein